MEDIAEKLSELLSSPDGIDKIKAVANSLLGDGGFKDAQPQPPDLPVSELGDMQTLLKLGKLLKSSPKDDRITLLLALKPHLSEKRRHKVDNAVAILRLSSLLPILTEQGLLNF